MCMEASFSNNMSSTKNKVNYSDIPIPLIFQPPTPIDLYQ